MVKHVYRSACKVPLLLSGFVMRLEFSRQFFEKYLSVKVMKIRPLAAELFLRTDGHTDSHDEANCRFSQYCKGP